MSKDFRYLIENKNIFKSGQLFLIYSFFVSQLFFLVSFNKIYTGPFSTAFSITVPFIISMIYLVFSLVGIILGEIRIKKERFYFWFVFTSVILLSMLFSKYDLNINSFFLAEYYILMFVFLDYRNKNNDSIKIIKIYIFLSTVFNLYGIYQFFAYNIFVDLPFKELIPSKLWTSNYNVIQYIRDDNFIGMIKPHSIYAEASFLSRISAINILLIYFLRKKINFFSIVPLLLINFISLILSMSGSGIIILLVGLIYIIYKADYRYKFFYVVTILASIVIIYNYRDNNFISYFLGRTNELNPENNYNTSGYYRFLLPMIIGMESIVNNFFGYGIGNDNIAYAIYNANESVITNGFGKIFVECGILGLIVIIYLFVLLKPNKNRKNFEVYFMMYIILIVCNFVGSFMEINFWCLALFVAANKE